MLWFKQQHRHQQLTIIRAAREESTREVIKAEQKLKRVIKENHFHIKLYKAIHDTGEEQK